MNLMNRNSPSPSNHPGSLTPAGTIPAMITWNTLSVFLFVEMILAAPTIFKNTPSSPELYPAGCNLSQCSRATSTYPWGKISDSRYKTDDFNTSTSDVTSSLVQVGSGDQLCRQIARYKLPAVLPDRQLRVSLPSILLPLHMTHTYWLVWSSNFPIWLNEMDSGRIGEWINQGVQAQYKGSKQYTSQALPELRLLTIEARARRKIDGELAVFEIAAPYTSDY